MKLLRVDLFAACRAHPLHAGGAAGCQAGYNQQGYQQDHQVTTIHALQQQGLYQHSPHRARPLHQHSHKQHMCPEPEAAPAAPPPHSVTATRPYTSPGHKHHHKHEVASIDAAYGTQLQESSSSVCGSEDSRSTISCSAEVVAAVAAARRRLQQQGNPVTWDANGAAGTIAADARGAGRAVGKCAASPPGAAALAALASCTLRKLELLSNESPAWC